MTESKALEGARLGFGVSAQSNGALGEGASSMAFFTSR
jgi:hypothetical protein